MSKLGIDAIVAIALDDLEQGHANLPTMLRHVASLAWQEGRSEAEHDQSGCIPVPYPAPRHAESPLLPNAATVA